MSQEHKRVRLLNFSHPFSLEQVEQLESIVGRDVEVVDIDVQLDPALPLTPQVVDLVARVASQPEDFIELPGLASAAVLVVTAFTGLHGHLPIIVRRGRTESVPVTFEVRELIDLDTVRNVTVRRTRDARRDAVPRKK